MARSRKDGRRRGGHVDHLCRELWSRRCKRVNGSAPSRWSKRVTHRLERRQGKRAAAHPED